MAAGTWGRPSPPPAACERPLQRCGGRSSPSAVAPPVAPASRHIRTPSRAPQRSRSRLAGLDRRSREDGEGGGLMADSGNLRRYSQHTHHHQTPLREFKTLCSTKYTLRAQKWFLAMEVPMEQVVSQASRNFSSCACALGRGAGEGKETPLPNAHAHDEKLRLACETMEQARVRPPTHPASGGRYKTRSTGLTFKMIGEYGVKYLGFRQCMYCSLPSRFLTLQWWFTGRSFPNRPHNNYYNFLLYRSYAQYKSSHKSATTGCCTGYHFAHSPPKCTAFS